MEEVQQYTVYQMQQQHNEMAMAQQQFSEQNEEIQRLRTMLLAQSTPPPPGLMDVPLIGMPQRVPSTPGQSVRIPAVLPEVEDDAIGQDWVLTPNRTRRVSRWQASALDVQDL